MTHSIEPAPSFNIFLETGDGSCPGFAFGRLNLCRSASGLTSKTAAQATTGYKTLGRHVRFSEQKHPGYQLSETVSNANRSLNRNSYLHSTHLAEQRQGYFGDVIDCEAKFLED